MTDGPYLGLRTYEERDKERFKGREELVAELVRTIRRSPLTIVFGVSGIGKSSLLQAGMFPAIRKESFLPVSIRIDFTSATPVVSQVRAAIARELERQAVDGKLPPPVRAWTKDIESAAPGESEPTPKPRADSSLATYFETTALWSKRNRLLTPVLVFDQFEEIFTRGRGNPHERHELLAEIAAIVEKRPVERGPLPEGAPPEPRVVVSLREDYLAPLEDYRNVLPSLVTNRLRVTRMTGHQAMRAIREPAPETVSDDVAVDIVRFVAAGGRVERSESPLEELTLEPSLLSLVCDELDRKRREAGESHLDSKWISEQGGEIVERFYERSFEDLSLATRAFVEDQLVTPDGFRTTVAAKAALDHGVAEADIRTLIDRRVLRSENRFDTPHIELMHDRLTRYALKGRTARDLAKREAAVEAAESEVRKRERERERRREERELREKSERGRRRWRILFGFVAFLLLLGLGLSWFLDRERTQHDHDVATQLAQTLSQEVPFAFTRGDLHHAAGLLWKSQSEYGEADGSPSTDDRVLAARVAVQLASEVVAVDHGSDVAWAAYRQDHRLVTVGEDGAIKTWSPSGEPTVERVDSPRLVFSSRGDDIVIVEPDGSGELRGAKIIPFEAIAGEPAKNAQDSDWGACVAPDRSAFAVWNRRGGVRAWKIADAKPQAAVPIQAGLAAVVCLDNGRLLIATSGEIARIVIFDPAKSELVVDVKAPESGTVGFLDAAENGSTFAAHLYSKTIGDLDTYVWPAGATTPPIALGVPNHVSSMSVSPDGKLVAVTVTPSLAAVWNSANGRLVFAVERSRVMARWAGNGILATASDHQIEAWDVMKWESRGWAANERGELSVFGFDVRRVGERLVATVSDGAIVRVVELGPDLWADRVVREGFMLGRWPLAESARRRVKDALRYDGPLGDSQKHLARYADDLHEGTPIATLDVATEDVLHASFFARSDGGSSIAVVTKRRELDVYDEENRAYPHVRHVATGIDSAGFTDDGRLFVVRGRTVEIWKAPNVVEVSLSIAADDVAPRISIGPGDLVWSCSSVCRAQTFEGVPVAELAMADRLYSTPLPMLNAAADGIAVLLPPIPPRHFGIPAPFNYVQAMPDGTIVARDRRMTSVVVRGARVGKERGIALSSDRSCARETAPGSDARCVGGRLVVVDEKFGVKVEDREGKPLITGALDGVRPRGRAATLSRNGVWFATIVGSDIEVRTVNDPDGVGAKSLKRYAIPGTDGVVDLVVSDNAAVVARMPSRLVLWKPSGEECSIPGHFDEVVMSGGGGYVAALERGRETIYSIPDTRCEIRSREPIPGNWAVFDAKGDQVAIVDEAGKKVVVVSLGTHGSDVLSISGEPSQVSFQPNGRALLVNFRAAGDNRSRAAVSVDHKRLTEIEGAMFCTFDPNGGAYDLGCVVHSGEDRGLRRFRNGRPIGDVTATGDYYFAETLTGRSAFGFVLTTEDRILVYDWLTRDVPTVVELPLKTTGVRSFRDALVALDAGGVLDRYPLPTGKRSTSSGGARVADSIATDNEARIVTMGADGTAIVHRLANGKDKSAALPADNLLDAKFAGFGRLVTHTEREVRVWYLDESMADPTSYRSIVLRTHEGAISIVKLVGPSTLGIGYADGTAELWNLDLLYAVTTVSRRGAAVRHIAIDDGNHWIAVAAGDGQITLWSRDAPEHELFHISAPVHSASGDRTSVLAFEAGAAARGLIVGTPSGDLLRYALDAPGPTVERVLFQNRTR